MTSGPKSSHPVHRGFLSLKYLSLMASFVFAIAGTVLIFKATAVRTNDTGLDLDQPRHLITRQMEIETAAMANRREPPEILATELGAKVQIAGADSNKPQFVVFIKDACPCSVEAQPHFNRLAERFGDRVQFVGIIDGDLGQAKRFASQFSVAFPVAPDKDLRVIHAYQARAGVYSALIARNGHLVKMWPGYSATLLQQMNQKLSEVTATKALKFDPQYAPKQAAAGCAYSS